jgi:Secretion system C-terminal sorting domain
MRKLYFLVVLCFGLTSFNSFSQINAENDIFGVVYGASDVIAGNILLNDSLNGGSIPPSQVTITILSSTNPGVYISGINVIVAGGTPRGTYTIAYQICTTDNTLCDSAIVTINTELIANPDYFDGFCPNVYVGNILGMGSNLNNIDTLNGVPAHLEPYVTQPGNVTHPADVVLTVIQGYPGVIDISSNGDVYLGPSSIIVSGNLTVTYQLCEIANPTNCDVGYLTVNIYPQFVQAQDDDFTSNPIDNLVGGFAGNVLWNDYSSCLGNLNNPSSTVTPIVLPNGLNLSNEGSVYVAIGTTPGIHLLYYNVCENLYGGCGTAYAFVAVTGISALVANYDDFSVPNYPNSSTASVLNNDTLNGSSFSPSLVSLTALNNPVGFTLDGNGTISIAPNVPEGTYTVPYQICLLSDPSVCYVNYAYVVVLKNRILGKVKFDADANGCDVNDSYLNNISVKNVNGSVTYSSSTYFNPSQYYLIGDSGINTVSVTGLPSYFTVTPATQVFNFTTPGTTVAPDFCITANASVDDLEIILIPLFNVVPGLPAVYDIWFKNNGSTTLSGQISFQFDNSKMSFLTSSPSPNSTTTNTLVYNYSNIAPFESRTINNVKFQVAIPPTVNLGDYASFSGSITPVVSDATPLNNSYAMNQLVVNSQDPNDIAVHEGQTITLDQAQQDCLHYTIRFQNIGTSDAINIKVVNDLEAKLDWSTFQLISTSHTCRVKNENGHNEFLFEGINLPGTNNEPLSHGYITYKVKPVSTVTVGDEFSNFANIYFDFNAPILTNTATTLIVPILNNSSFAFSNLNYFPNPVKNSLTISNDTLIDSIEVSSILGQQILSQKVNSLQTEINLSTLSNGIYFVKVVCNGAEKTLKVIKE